MHRSNTTILVTSFLQSQAALVVQGAGSTMQANEKSPKPLTFRKYTSSHTSHMSRRKTLLHISRFPYEKKIAFLSFVSRLEFLSDRKFMHRLKSGSYTRTFSSECRLLVGKLRFNTTRLKWKPTTHVPCERAERPKSNSKQ